MPEDVQFRREWITEGDDTTFWPLVDFQVKTFGVALVGAALWVVLNREHTEAVKAGTQKPSNAQLSMTPDQARRLGQSLLDAAAYLTPTGPAN